jgi:hypothetical protein
MLERWRPDVQATAERLYLHAAQRFVELANGFVQKLASSGNSAFSELPRPVPLETCFRVRSRLYYTSLMTLAGDGPIDWVLDTVRPRNRQIRALEHQIGDYLESILRANANAITNDFDDRVLESQRRMRAEIGSSIKAVIVGAEQALTRAKECLAEGAQAVRLEVVRLDKLIDSLAEITQSDIDLGATPRGSSLHV